MRWLIQAIEARRAPDLTACRTLEAMHRSENFVHRTSMIEGVRANPTLVATPSQESVSHDDAWNRVSSMSHEFAITCLGFSPTLHDLLALPRPSRGEMRRCQSSAVCPFAYLFSGSR